MKIIGYGAALLAVMLAAVFAARLMAPEAMSGGQQMSLAYSAGWLALLICALFFGARVSPSQAIRSLLAWTAILLALVALYTLRGPLLQLAGDMQAELRPGVVSTPAGEPATAAAAAVRRGMGGHFWAEGMVDGHHVRFLVDTGATVVVLSREDARRVGVDLDSLSYNQPMMTANGETYAAGVTLDEIHVGNVRVRDVQAAVPQDDMLATSLLGMSFLGRLSRYEATRSTLILRQ